MSPKPVPQASTLWSAVVVKNEDPTEYNRIVEANRAQDEERRMLQPIRTREERAADAREA